MTRTEEAQSSQPEAVEEPMEESQHEISDLQEPVKDVEADVMESEAGSKDVEWLLKIHALYTIPSFPADFSGFIVKKMLFVLFVFVENSWGEVETI